MWLMLMIVSHLWKFQLSRMSSSIITYKRQKKSNSPGTIFFQKLFRDTLIARNDIFTPKLACIPNIFVIFTQKLTKKYWCDFFHLKLIIVPCFLWSIIYLRNKSWWLLLFVWTNSQKPLRSKTKMCVVVTKKTKRTIAGCVVVAKKTKTTIAGYVLL